MLFCVVPFRVVSCCVGLRCVVPCRALVGSCRVSESEVMARRLSFVTGCDCSTRQQLVSGGGLYWRSDCILFRFLQWLHGSIDGVSHSLSPPFTLSLHLSHSPSLPLSLPLFYPRSSLSPFFSRSHSLFSSSTLLLFVHFFISALFFPAPFSIISPQSHHQRLHTLHRTATYSIPFTPVRG